MTTAEYESSPEPMHPTVFVVDDDPIVRHMASSLVQSMGVRAAQYESAEAFLDAYQGEPGCVVSDYRMAGRTGLELHEELACRRQPLPVILVTAFAKTSLTVQALQSGVVTLLEKPFDDDDLWQAVRSALQCDAQQRRLAAESAARLSRFAELNDREREVMEMIVRGEQNKAIAAALDVSLRTVENRRRQVFHKLGVNSVAELVAFVLQTEGLSLSNDSISALAAT